MTCNNNERSECMSRQFKITVEYPNQKPLGVGVLSIDEKGEALFFEGHADGNSRTLAHMLSSRLVFAGAHVICIEGHEPCGFDNAGRQKTKYQKWYLRYV